MIKYSQAYCAPLGQVMSIPQLKLFLSEYNPLVKHLRFYCPEPCCQASLLYTLSLDHFSISRGARHARECPHFWIKTTEEKRAL